MKRALKKRVNAVVENTVSDDASVEQQIEELDSSEAHPRARTKAAMIGLAISMGATSLLVTRQNDRALAAESVGSQEAASSLPAASENDVSFAPRQTSGYGVFSNTSVPDNQQTVEIKAIPDWKGLGNKGKIAALKSAKLPLPKIVSSQGAVKNISSLKETLKTAKQQTAVKVSDENDFAGGDGVTHSTQPRIVVPTASVNFNVNAQLKAQQESAIERLQQKSNRLRDSLAQLRSGEIKKLSPVVSSDSLRSSNPVKGSTNNISQVRRQISGTKGTTVESKPQRFNPGIVAGIPAIPGVVAPTKAQPYSVKSGDTLGEIAQSYGTSVAELAKLNDLNNPDKLQLDQQLVIPSTQDSVTSSVRTVAFNPHFKSKTHHHVGGDKASTLASREIEGEPQSTIGSGFVSSTKQSDTKTAAYGMGGQAPTPLVFADMRLAKAKAASDKNPKYNQRLRNLKAEIERLRAKYRAQKSRQGGASGVEVVKLPQTKNVSNSEGVLKQNNSVPVPIAVPKASSSTAAVPKNSRTVAIPVPKAIQSNYNNRPNTQFIQHNSPAVTPRTNNLSTPLPPLAAASIYLPRPIENIQPKSKGYIWPAKGVLTSGYGPRWGRMHRGIDIANKIGTPIVAAADGVVTFEGRQRGYGKIIDIRHTNGSLTRYAHNHRHFVKQGQKVKQGQMIAHMGNTGFSTGPHLHFEIHPTGKRAVNPIAYLPSRR